MSRVWGDVHQDYADGSKHAGSELLLLMAIADFADDDGNAFPAIGTLAKKCRLSERYVNMLLAKLRDSGELEIHLNEGWRGANRYRITLGVNSTSPLKPASPRSPLPKGVKPASGGDEARFPKPLKPASPEPSRNRHRTTKEPSGEKRASKSRSNAADFFPDVAPQVLHDFEAVRKAKRAGPITETAANGIKREAAKAGLTVQQALEMCAERGWTSIKASWESVAGATSAGKNQSTRRTFGGMNYRDGIDDDGRILP